MEHQSAPGWSAIVGDRPFQSNAPYIPIRRAKPGAPVRGYILTSVLVGRICHYLDASTLPCRITEGLPCEGCEAKRQRRWHGYLALQLVPGGQIVLGEVTEDAVARCPALNAVTNLRGLYAQIQRAGPSPRSRILLSIDVPAKPIAGLARPVPITEALERIWGQPFHVDGRPIAQAEGGDA